MERTQKTPTGKEHLPRLRAQLLIGFVTSTPRKINIEPENDGLEDDFPFPGGPVFSASTLIFQGVFFSILYRDPASNSKTSTPGVEFKAPAAEPIFRDFRAPSNIN